MAAATQGGHWTMLDSTLVIFAAAIFGWLLGTRPVRTDPAFTRRNDT